MNGFHTSAPTTSSPRQSKHTFLQFAPSTSTKASHFKHANHLWSTGSCEESKDTMVNEHGTPNCQLRSKFSPFSSSVPALPLPQTDSSQQHAASLGQDSYVAANSHCQETKSLIQPYTSHGVWSSLFLPRNSPVISNLTCLPQKLIHSAKVCPYLSQKLTMQSHAQSKPSRDFSTLTHATHWTHSSQKPMVHHSEGTHLFQDSKKSSHFTASMQRTSRGTAFAEAPQQQQHQLAMLTMKYSYWDGGEVTPTNYTSTSLEITSSTSLPTSMWLPLISSLPSLWASTSELAL